MDYKDKYKQALERARKLQKTCDSTAVIGWCEYIFPELRESEDEKVRKTLIRVLNENVGNGIEKYGAKLEEALAWLEKQGTSYTKRDVDDAFVEGMALAKDELKKQGEQKPTDKEEPRFHERDWVVYKNDICQIVKREEGCNKLVTVFGIEKELVNERNLSTARLWTIKDAKPGDILAEDPLEGHPSSFVAIYKKQNEVDFDDFDSYCFVGFDGKFYEGEDGHSTENIHPATKEQRDLLFQKMKEEGYEWDGNNKILKEIVEDEKEPQNYKNQVMSEITDLVKHYIKQKSAWSEAGEDMKEALRTEYEKGRADAIAQIQQEWSDKGKQMCADIIEATKKSGVFKEAYKRELVDWLKALRPQNHWKPSDEQMKALDATAGIVGILTPTGVTLCSLYKDLEKLKGE